MQCRAAPLYEAGGVVDGAGAPAAPAAVGVAAVSLGSFGRFHDVSRVVLL